jgi:hypothetical protein
MMETLFTTGNLAATAGWLLLLVALFAPGLRATAFVVCGIVMPALLSAAYLGLLSMAFASPPPGGVDFGSLAGVQALLTSDVGATTGWYHYLAFDMVIGTWIARDGLSRGVWRLALLPALVLTFLAGPVGLLTYLVLRTVKQGPVATPLGPTA